MQEYAGGRGGEARGSGHREPLIAIAGTDEGGLPLRSGREQSACARLRVNACGPATCQTRVRCVPWLAGCWHR